MLWQARGGNIGSVLRTLLYKVRRTIFCDFTPDSAMFLVEAKDRPVRSPFRAIDLVVEKNRYGGKIRAL